MKIGIIVYSRSGHTELVADRISEKLSDAGHDVEIKRLEPLEPVKVSVRQAVLKSIPAIRGYDILIIGSPVQGGAPAAPVLEFLNRVPSMKEKRTVIFATHFFRREWGAVQSLAILKDLCESKGARILSLEDIRWFAFDRNQEIDWLGDRISSLITK